MCRSPPRAAGHRACTERITARGGHGGHRKERFGGAAGWAKQNRDFEDKEWKKGTIPVMKGL